MASSLRVRANQTISKETFDDISADPRRYPQLQFLESLFLTTLRLFHIFNDGNVAILVTNRDEVYGWALGDSGNYLGLKDQQLMCIKTLSGKKVVSLSCGSRHVLLLTEDGHVYSWGDNNHGQLGNNTMTNSSVPILCTRNLEKKKIVQIACGATQSLVLTSEGELFHHGIIRFRSELMQDYVYLNGIQFQRLPPDEGSVPTQLQDGIFRPIPTLEKMIIKSIACGENHSLVLCDTGAVYSWGSNDAGQLGLGHTNAQPNPCRVVALDDYCIVELACGASHSMALTHDGTIFTWGHNSNGQLGLGRRNNISTPTRINLPDVQFIQIAAARHVSSCAALTFREVVYIWGPFSNIHLLTPTYTCLPSLHDVFSPQTWKPVANNKEGKVRLDERINQAFNDPETSDIKFIIDGKYLYAHKTILQLRCPYFQDMFRSNWKETVTGEIQITAFTYEVYKAFLNYVYTDKLYVTAEIAMFLVHLSHSYHEAHLTQLCERILCRSINGENTAALYEFAAKYDCSELTEYCVMYSMKHMSEISESEAFIKMDGEMTKKLIRDCSRKGIKK